MNEINRSIHILSIGISVIGFTACNGGSNYIPVSSATQEESAITDIPDSSDEKTNLNVIPTDSSFTVAFNETKSGVKTIHIKFNDAAGFNAIFDTAILRLFLRVC